jgi:hypothetical protein
VALLASKGGGGGGFAADHKTLPAIAHLMETHRKDAVLQLRACQTLHKILCAPCRTNRPEAEDS